MAELKLALLQMNIIPGNPQQNRENAVQLISKAMISNPDIIALPEMWTTAYQLDTIHDICDVEGMPTFDLISDQAKSNHVNIVAGSYASMENEKIFNTAYVFDNQGSNIAKYQKIHLFKLMSEHLFFEAGSQYCIFQLAGVRCGLIICYDLRFPELTRKLAVEGVELLFVPAQWPAVRQEHWEILLRARAIENQIFIAAVNAAGVHSEDKFQGGSMIIGPWGEVLAKADYKEQVLCAEINLDNIKKAREKIDILGDRMPEIY